MDAPLELTEEERRTIARREFDPPPPGDVPPRQSFWGIALVTGGVSLATTLLVLGIAWGTAGEKLANKVDRATYAEDRETMRSDIRALTLSLNNVVQQLGTTNDRLRRIYCDGKPAGCQ